MFRRCNATNGHDKVLKAYNLSAKIVLEAHHLDDSDRVLSYPDDCLIEFERMLDTYYTGKVIVTHNDPELPIFWALEVKGLIILSVLPNVGAEHFAAEMFNWMKVWLVNSGLINRVDVKAIEVVESQYSSSLYTE